MSRRWTIGAGVVAGYVALALFLGVSNALTNISMGRQPLWTFAIGRALIEWLLWAALTPALAWYTRRVPFDRRQWPSALAAHVAGAVTAATLKLYLDRTAIGLVFGFRSYILVSTFALNLLIYAVIVAAAYGLAIYRAGRARELRASQLETRLAEARLQALEVQLQPHFLFNTLNTIAELVHEDPETADRMITGLSRMLRETLDAGAAHEVTLARELDLLGLYLGVQQERFGDRLEVDVDVAAAVRQALVPFLVLQPLVENAIRHGLSGRGGGRIGIRARVAGDTLTVEVRDSGPGLDPDGLRDGIGLANTRARLRELYGERQRVEIRNAPDGGAAVVLALPYREAPAGGGAA